MDKFWELPIGTRGFRTRFFSSKNSSTLGSAVPIFSIYYIYIYTHHRSMYIYICVSVYNITMWENGFPQKYWTRGFLGVESKVRVKKKKMKKAKEMEERVIKRREKGKGLNWKFQKIYIGFGFDGPSPIWIPLDVDCYPIVPTRSWKIGPIKWFSFFFFVFLFWSWLNKIDCLWY